jgi:uncharacterized OsmC-like protein
MTVSSAPVESAVLDEDSLRALAHGGTFVAMDRAMSTPIHEFGITVDQVDGYEYRIRFDKPQYPEIRADEPEPLGKDSAPNAARLLAAAVANCLTASLQFCMSRAGSAPAKIRSEAKVQIVRNEQRRLRVGRIDVVIRPTTDVDDEALKKCIETFQDFCTVTASVKQGFDIGVTVVPEAP